MNYMTAQDAENLVVADLGDMSGFLAVIPDTTYETTKCFVVFCQSTEYIETGNSGSFLIGNGATLVDKVTKKLYHTGSSRRVESYIASYEKYGDPFLGTDIFSLKIELASSHTNHKLDQLKALKATMGMGTSEAKDTLEKLKNGGSIIIPDKHSWEPRETLLANGFTVTQLITTV